MQIVSFSVEGFKNLTAPITLEDLGTIEVIHGDNNVGKSNLVEAMSLYFALLDIESEGWLPVARPARISDEALQQRGFTRADIFNLARPAPIRLAARLALPEDELAVAGVQPLIPSHRVDIGLELVRVGAECELKVTHFIFADGTDATQRQESAERKQYVLRFARFLAREFIFQSAKVRRFQVVTANRVFGLPGMDAGVPDEVLLALYDATQSSDLAEVRRGRALLTALESFSDLVGEGEWMPTFERKSGRANLVFETATARIPLRLMGSGVQQIVGLLGRLLMTRASFVAIEEPEMNLRFSLQARLAETFRSLVGKPGAPTQIFITSHSPTFESGDSFIQMRAGPTGPTVERRERAHAGEATGVGVDVPSPQGRVPLGYVSTDGFVRVPERVQRLLGVEHGGEIMFVGNTPGAVELVSEAEFAKRYDPPESDRDDA